MGTSQALCTKEQMFKKDKMKYLIMILLFSAQVHAVEIKTILNDEYHIECHNIGIGPQIYLCKESFRGFQLCYRGYPSLSIPKMEISCNLFTNVARKIQLKELRERKKNGAK